MSSGLARQASSSGAFRAKRIVATGATKWGDPAHFPWTMGWQPTYPTEGHILAQCYLQYFPNAQIGVLYQNDDYGKDYPKDLKDRRGPREPSSSSRRSATRPPTRRSIRRSSR